MKILLDFLPILLFFVTFKFADGHKDWAAAFVTEHLGFLVAGGKVGVEEAPVLLATVVVVMATMAQVAWLKARGRKVDLMLWISLVLVVVLGGLTVWLHSDTFIKWKPTLLYWTMALTVCASQAIFKRNPLRLLMGEQLTLPGEIWRRLNLAWIAFLSAMGILNLWVAYSFSTGTWVNFKLFGGVGLMLAFTLAQGFYLSRYPHGEPAEGATQSAEPPARAS